MSLSDAEQIELKAHLRIVEMRKAFRGGINLPRFPVKPERGEVEAFEGAENTWRSLIRSMDAYLYIIDPLRGMHAQAENDSTIEALLTRIHQFSPAVQCCLSICWMIIVHNSQLHTQGVRRFWTVVAVAVDSEFQVGRVGV
jgi:hypothetical protein